MRKLFTGPGLRLAVVGLMLLVGVLSPGPALAASGPDYAIAGGWFFTQTGGGQGRGFAVSDALADANGRPIKFWTAFQRLGGVATLGYPIGQLYGLPMSAPERHGPFLSQRFQRVAFQLWLDNVPGMPAPGRVVAVLGGDLLNESGLLPATSTQPLGPGGVVMVQPAATPAPQATVLPSATWPWHVTYVTGYPNCGTTYIRAYTRAKNGLGVSGLILKSWNEGGNVYIATSRYANGTDGYWDRIISSGPSAGTWYVQLLDGNLNPASAIVTVNTTANCDPNQGPAIQKVEMAFQPS